MGLLSAKNHSEEGKKGGANEKANEDVHTDHHHQSNYSIASPVQRGEEDERADKIVSVVVDEGSLGTNSSSSAITPKKEGRSSNSASTQKREEKEEEKGEGEKKSDKRKEDAYANDGTSKHEQQQQQQQQQKRPTQSRKQHVSSTSIVEQHAHQHEKPMGGRTCDDICQGYCNGKDVDCPKRCGVACFGERFIVRF
eukprot:jgi/Bigna1/132745/aug1.18_g7453